MNMFELSAFGSPVVGIITSLRSTEGSVLWAVISGACVGLGVGCVCLLITEVLDKYVCRVISPDREKNLTYSQLVVGHIAAFLWTVIPFVAWPVTIVLVRTLP